MSERQKVWQAHLGVEVSPTNGHATFCHFGYLTECGEWVDGTNVRWPRTPEWCDTQEEALARLAPKIAQIGARLIQQASELRAREVRAAEVLT